MMAKKVCCILICMILTFTAALGEGLLTPKETRAQDGAPDVLERYTALFCDMVNAYMDLSEETAELIEADIREQEMPLIGIIAGHWKQVWLDPDYRLYLDGVDDPAELPITGRHAFVVLGFALVDGEMAEELVGRCNAAAAAARAFPDSFIVCSGGATGRNNPGKHTEAGLMKAYLVEACGIAPERILIDERAMNTAENAVNTMEILMANGIETMTVITSSYHQRRGQTLYNAVAGRYSLERGYTVEIIGNYCYPAETSGGAPWPDHLVTVFQLAEIVGLPSAVRSQLLSRLTPAQDQRVNW
jgi:hypothetical protein